jgi:hypothetical protein
MIRVRAQRLPSASGSQRNLASCDRQGSNWLTRFGIRSRLHPGCESIHSHIISYKNAHLTLILPYSKSHPIAHR